MLEIEPKFLIKSKGESNLISSLGLGRDGMGGKSNFRS